MNNLLNAKEAYMTANTARHSKEISFLDDCLLAIKEAAEDGNYYIALNYSKYYDIIDTIVSKLVDLGYTVSFCHNSMIHISWEFKND